MCYLFRMQLIVAGSSYLLPPVRARSHVLISEYIIFLSLSEIGRMAVFVTLPQRRENTCSHAAAAAAAPLKNDEAASLLPANEGPRRFSPSSPFLPLFVRLSRIRVSYLYALYMTFTEYALSLPQERKRMTKI